MRRVQSSLAATCVFWLAASTTAAHTVEEFGAQGNGVTDDTAAIQAALNAAPAGGTVTFTPGRTYRIAGTSTGLAPKSQTRLVLHGATLIGAAHELGGRHRFFTVHAKTDVTISGGTFIGSRAGAPEWGLGVLVSDSSHVIVEDASFRDFFTDGILVTGNSGCRYVVVRRCRVTGSGRAGIGLIAGSDIVVEDSIFENTNNTNTNMPRSGLHGEPNSEGALARIAVTRCVFRNNQGSGLYFLVGHGTGLSDVTLTDNVAQGNGFSGILLKGASGVVVRGNRVAGHTNRNGYAIGLADRVSNAVVRNNVLEGNYRGVYVEGGDGVNIEANSIVGTRAGKVFREGDDGDGVQLRASGGSPPTPSRAATIAGNLIREVAGRGISAAQASGFTIADNVIVDSGQHGIHIRTASSDAQVVGNVVARSSMEGDALYQHIFVSQSAARVLVAQNLVRDGTHVRSGIALDNVAGSVVTENCVAAGATVPLAVSESASTTLFSWRGTVQGWNRGEGALGMQFYPMDTTVQGSRVVDLSSRNGP